MFDWYFAGTPFLVKENNKNENRMEFIRDLSGT